MYRDFFIVFLADLMPIFLKSACDYKLLLYFPRSTACCSFSRNFIECCMLLVTTKVTGRDVTLLARRVLLIVSYVAPWSVTEADRRQTTATDDDRHQQPLLVWHPYTMCKRASNTAARMWRTRWLYCGMPTIQYSA